jgi:single-strand DNA-binding protein
MNDLNNVVLTGRVTRDVELKYTTNGSAVANFSIAVNEGVKQPNGQWEDKGNFFDVSLWGKSAETLTRFLTKGKRITVQGRLRQQTWQDQEGRSRSKVIVNAQFVQLLSPIEGRESQGSDRRPPNEDPPRSLSGMTTQNLGEKP